MQFSAESNYTFNITVEYGGKYLNILLLFFLASNMEKLHMYSKGNCLLPAAAPGLRRALTKESSYQMHAQPLFWGQQLDDCQRLPGKAILEMGQDVLLAHQLRIKHSSPLGLGPNPRAAPTTLRGKSHQVLR